MKGPIKVLVVEDSRSQRELLVGLLQSSGFEVVGTASNGRDAIAATMQLRPQVIAMDINLPGLDGYEATRQIMERCPTPVVMITGERGDDRQREDQARAVGALAAVRKPLSLGALVNEQERSAFLTTLRLMADVRVVTHRPARRFSQPSGARQLPSTAPALTPQVLGIAASTGGPTALQSVLQALGRDFQLPILVVQHITRGFVQALVSWLEQTVPQPVQLAGEDQRLLPGHVYLAPDHQHLVVHARGHATLRPPVAGDAFCPSADALFQSLARHYGARALGVVLTGMGDDGAQGLLALRAAGGQILAQDEASCVVYGMPRAAVLLGAVDQVVPLALMPDAIRGLLDHATPGA